MGGFFGLAHFSVSLCVPILSHVVWPLFQEFRSFRSSPLFLPPLLPFYCKGILMNSLLSLRGMDASAPSAWVTGLWGEAGFASLMRPRNMLVNNLGALDFDKAEMSGLD